MLQGIADEIREYLYQAIGIGVHHRSHQRLLKLQFHRIWTTELEQLLDILTQLVDIRLFFLDLDFTRFYSGEVKDLVNQTRQTLVVTFDNLIIFQTVLFGVGLNDDARKTLNSVQRGTDFMGHVGKEERFHLTGFLSLQSLLFVFFQLSVCYLQLLCQEV